MAFLTIIGNGFDLAHNLKTSYTDFFRDIVGCELEGISRYPDLMRVGMKTDIDTFFERRKIKNFNDGTRFDDLLFKKLIEDFSLKNWSDVELTYFKCLLNTLDPTLMKPRSKDDKILDIENLNKSFKRLKTYFEKYLSLATKNVETFDPFQYYFDKISISNSFVINFNYTESVSNYMSSTNVFEVIHIHGQLNSETNPIIFGYNTNDSDTTTLLQQGDNKYLDHTKYKHYRRTGYDRRIEEYLSLNETINLLCFGHSFGMSDAPLLKKIVTHDHVKNVHLFYHNSFENYSNQESDLNRILDNGSAKDKIVDYNLSHRMPQHDDDDLQFKEFKIFLDQLLVRYRPRGPRSKLL